MKWPSMAAMANRAHAAKPKSSASGMHRMRLTIVRIARPQESCWPTALLAACFARIGHERLKNWKNAAERDVALRYTVEDGRLSALKSAVFAFT
jgi:hypothetical protein